MWFVVERVNALRMRKVGALYANPWHCGCVGNGHHSQGKSQIHTTTPPARVTHDLRVRRGDFTIQERTTSLQSLQPWSHGTEGSTTGRRRQLSGL